MLRILAAYLAGVVVTYAAAAAVHTQFVVASLERMGVRVPAADRAAATLHDLAGMAALYLPIIAVGLAAALPVAALVIRYRPRWRPLGYPLAGGLALLAIHVVLYQTFSITPIASARSTAGLTLQALAGALGGWVFLTALPRRNRPPRTAPAAAAAPARGDTQP